MNFAFRNSKSDFIGGTVYMTTLDAAASHPNREPIVMVVSAHLGCQRHLRGGRSAEFATPEHESVVEHAAIF